MPKSPNQKLKLLYLAKILSEESDEAHPLTIADLAAALARRGIAAERKSLYDDLEALERFGLDIVVLRGRGNAYYLGERHFQLPEIKLLVDAVQSAKFISLGKSQALIIKICALASRHQGGVMQRQVYVQGRAKTFNEHSYYNVDAIQNALAENRQIQFRYYEWVVAPKSARLFTRRWRHGGRPYQVSPWSLLWDDEFYYLLAYDEAAGIIKHYRVDKMDDIALCGEARSGRAVFEGLDLAQYNTRTFGMFGGTETAVRLRFANRLVGVVVDRFGQNVIIHADGPHHFVTTVQAVVSPQFFSWLFGFGAEVEVLAPQALIHCLRQELAAVSALYEK